MRILGLILLLAWSIGAEVRSLTILHLNDMHARLLPMDDGSGGFAYLASVIRHERANCSDCILLSAGDMVQGTPVSTLYHGLPIYEIANLFGFDAATLGNHEFDYGWMQARKFVETAKFPIVSANLVNAKGEPFTPKPYTILNVNGLRVAVIGGITEQLPALTNPSAVGDWHPTSLLDAVRQNAAEVRDKADLIVLLGHIDSPEERAVLEKIPDVAVLVTGHVHTGFTEAVTRDGRILVRVKSNGVELGRLDLKVDTETKKAASFTWKRIAVDSTKVQPASDVAAVVKKWEDQASVIVDRPLAVSNRAFTSREVKPLMERAIRESTGVDFAFVNSGGVRASLPKGQLMERHVWNIMPFDNVVVVGTFKGKDLPPVVLEGRKVEPDREYTLAVSDFTANNQGTAENLRTTGLKFDHQIGLMRDILLDWFRKKKVIE